MINEPWGEFTGRSSTLAVLADSGPFLGLLLTVLGSYVGREHSQFWPILAHFMDYYSLFWDPGVISMCNEPWCAFTCRSSTLAVLADSSPFLRLLLTVLRSRSDFHSY